MEAAGEDEYWMPELMGDDDDWVSRYLQGRGASLDLGNVTIEGQLQTERTSQDISEQLRRNTPETDASNIHLSMSSLGMEHVHHPLPQQAQARVPFSRRWEFLKPELERLYVDENVRLSDIIKIMREQHDFDAIDSQYKYQFKKWGFKKNTKSSEKQSLIQISEKRANLGKSTMITYKGKPIDPRKLRREAKKMARGGLPLNTIAGTQSHVQTTLQKSSFLFSNRIFLKWNMPFGVLFVQDFGQVNCPSPLGVSVCPHSDFKIHTPPELVGSRHDVPSTLQLSTALLPEIAIRRAGMFVQGRYNELIKSLNEMEARTMSVWLYQFWAFGFTTAKHWGRGPRTWNAMNLGFMNSKSPFLNLAADGSPSNDFGRQIFGEFSGAAPSQLCRWSIHPEYYLPGDDESPCSSESEGDPDDEALGPKWPEGWEEPPFEELLRDNLESNDFSTINMNQLPVAISTVAKAVKSSPNELLEEAIGFSIMGRNASLLRDLLQKAEEAKLDISNMYPFHLAVSYLDGSKSCCLILNILFEYTPYELRQKYQWFGYINDLGHTILDNLMITILRNHTSISPGTIDSALRTDRRFPGQEVNICGRWDADSETYRELLSSGKFTVPFEWKHKFCHTSAQAVYHCITVLENYCVSLSAPSGLFLKHCTHCGAKLQLSPLHTLVLTSFYLGTAGCQDEDLFGMICCLLSLLACGVDPFETADLSLPMLMGVDDGDACSHEIISAAELAERLSKGTLNRWPGIAKTGWQIFCHILHIAEETEFESESESERESEEDVGEFGKLGDLSFPLSCTYHEELGVRGVFGRDRTLGHLWAAAQTELLTYRRQHEGDHWTSENFNLASVLQSLEEGTELSVPLLGESMMKPYCACGFFKDCSSSDSPHQNVACLYYFSNLYDPSRTTYINEDALWNC